MNEVKENICRVPVAATMQIINGEPAMIAAEYADIWRLLLTTARDIPVLKKAAV